ncbi:MAG: metallophosphoesterase [Anaerolineales bacterium]|nr:metallophosphoesterase [Anaerolineales bacterium]
MKPTFESPRLGLNFILICGLLFFSLSTASGFVSVPARISPFACSTATLLAAGNTWKYLVTPSAPNASWKTAGFDDSGWPGGAAQLGYGDGDEATTIGYGPDGNNKYPTTYFRTTFSMTSTALYSEIQLGLLRDDGAAVYLNGVEVMRSNLPVGAITYTTYASNVVIEPEETTFFTVTLPITAVVAGVNQLAVEVHQANATSSDLSFDLQVTATTTDCPTPTPTATPVPCDTQPATVRFAVIGDFGANTPEEAAVATLVKSWGPQFIITTGDNSYPDSSTQTQLDTNVGQYYWEYIYPYNGTYTTSVGGPIAPANYNRFWPSAGNHDWYNTTDLAPYRAFFSLPNNERYYTFTAGPVAFFAVSSDGPEPDGITAASVQGQWLQAQLAASNAPWQVVYFHHPPYSSGSVHGSTANLQWPFKAWGADVILSGHVHNYERLNVGSLPYIVNGAGGAGLYGFAAPLPESQVRYSASHGAQLVEASTTGLRLKFINTAGTVIDDLVIGCAPGIPASYNKQVYLPLVRR